MSTFDYVDIPQDAIRLQSPPTSNPVRPFIKISTPLPSPGQSSSSDAPPPPVSTTFSPAKSLSAFLSTSLPTSIPTSACPRKTSTALLSTRDPLSIPITTANFRRFVARVGPVFWLQDRVEEVLMWRRGWKVTAVWISVYAFLCTCCLSSLFLFHLSLALDHRLLPSPGTPSPTRSASSDNALDVSYPLPLIRIHIIEKPTSSNRASSLRGQC